MSHKAMEPSAVCSLWAGSRLRCRAGHTRSGQAPHSLAQAWPEEHAWGPQHVGERGVERLQPAHTWMGMGGQLAKVGKEHPAHACAMRWQPLDPKLQPCEAWLVQGGRQTTDLDLLQCVIPRLRRGSTGRV